MKYVQKPAYQLWPPCLVHQGKTANLNASHEGHVITDAIRLWGEGRKFWWGKKGIGWGSWMGQIKVGSCKAAPTWAESSGVWGPPSSKTSAKLPRGKVWKVSGILWVIQRGKKDGEEGSRLSWGKSWRVFDGRWRCLDFIRYSVSITYIFRIWRINVCMPACWAHGIVLKMSWEGLDMSVCFWGLCLFLNIA